MGRVSFFFAGALSSYVRSIFLPFVVLYGVANSFTPLLIAFLTRAVSSFLLLVLCTIKYNLFRIMKFVYRDEETEVY